MGSQPSSLRRMADEARSSSSQQSSSCRLSEPFEAQKEPRVIFHLIRHGQAAHNDNSLPPKDAAAMHDPSLTSVGTSQCLILHEKFPAAPYKSKADLILCSPLLRTRQTAFLAFPPSPSTPKITLWPPLREFGRALCNTGLPLSQLLQELDPEIWDCSLVTEGWETEFLEFVDGSNIAQERFRHAQRVKRELYALAKVLVKGGVWKGLRFEKWEAERDVEVVVVSHGNFLSTVCEFDRPKFYNAEWKTVAFPTEKMMKKKGWWRTFTKTSLLRIEVERRGEKVYRGGKADSVPSRLSEATRKAPRESTRKLEEGVDVKGKGKELTVEDKDEIVEDAGEDDD